MQESPNQNISQTDYDVIILGAGAAGLMCAITAGQRGRRVAVVDHSRRLGGKILISGGGRCNFTNRGAGPKNYVSQNPHFCKSALSRYTPPDFIAVVEAHSIPYHEKKLGQLFCDRSSRDIVALLEAECAKWEIRFFLESEIESVDKPGAALFSVQLKGPNQSQRLQAPSVVVATGGLSLPKLGATGFGYDLAQKFGLSLVPQAPALDGFTWNDADLKKYGDLAGVATDVEIAVKGANSISFQEAILFTHQGLSGPAALQASLHWHEGESVRINFFPKGETESVDIEKEVLQEKRNGSRNLLRTVLGNRIPRRLAERLCQLESTPEFNLDRPLQALSEKRLQDFCQRLQNWEFTPKGTVGYSKAEVTRGGVDTNELSSKTMESKKVPGLYFIGEVVDVTGWLGGYNFQWAWASGWAAGQVV